MTEAELTAERLAALLDAERENTALRTQISELYKTADAAYRGGYREGAENEQFAVVAWLRECADTAHTGNTAGELRWAAIRIERGAHRDRREDGV